MLDRFFEGVNYYDFPSFEVAIFSLGLAFVLSTIIAVTYQMTFEGDHFPNNFFQAMILSSIVTSMIMMAVGNNLAIGFGIIGAVAIIRFRTLIQDPRNIIFMFAGISIGITTGVYGYAVSIGGTLIFCFTAIILRISPYGKIAFHDFEVVLFYNEETFSTDELFVQATSIKLISQKKSKEGGFRKEFRVQLQGVVSEESLFHHLQGFEDISEVRIQKKKINNPL